MNARSAAPGPRAPGDWAAMAWLAAALIAIGAWIIWHNVHRRPAAPPRAAGGALTFCFWNAENLFDDRDDPADHDPDEDWFGRDPSAVAAKVRLLAAALRLQGGGRGPDVIALAEVESRRAVELLRDAMDQGLDRADRYTSIVFRANRTGRRIAPALLSRVPAREDHGRDFGIRRILAARLGDDAAPLVVLVSHWTSRLTDTTGAKRSAYADALYRAFLDLRRDDPGVDALLAGDFNDEPGDPSLRDHLHAVADPALVRAEDRAPRLLDLTARLDPSQRGTYFHRGRWEVLDHLVASPGLLDPAGWSVVPGSLRVADDRGLRARRGGPPLRFGNERNPATRGPSDHFAVCVDLVEAKAGP